MNLISNDNNFKFFTYKANLLKDTVAQPAVNAANGILKNAAIAMLLKYLSNFWRWIEILLISCKVQLKLRWTKYCVLSAGGNDNSNNNTDNIIFTIKVTKLYVSVVILSARSN